MCLSHTHTLTTRGLLPLIYNHGFGGTIFATKATTDLCNIMLKDSAHIREFEAEWKNRKARRAGRPEVTPMYNVEDAQNVMQHFTPCDYNSVYEICPGLKVRFVDAGHLLGSSSIEMWVTEENVTKKIVFRAISEITTGRSSRIRSMWTVLIMWLWNLHMAIVCTIRRPITRWSLQRSSMRPLQEAAIW